MPATTRSSGVAWSGFTDCSKEAAVLGSLINPRAAEGDLLEAGFHELQPLLEKALAQEAKDDTAHEMAVTARGLAKAAEILAGQFTLVATNVPYLGRRQARRHCSRTIASRIHPRCKADLATCFVERCIDFCRTWTEHCARHTAELAVLTIIREIRENDLLEETHGISSLGLGAGCFQDINW